MRRLLPMLGLLGLWVLSGVAVEAAKKKPRHVPPGELTNPLLGPRYAQWLVGPISWLVTDAERDRYLFLSSDEEAEAFIESFWQEHADIKEDFEERLAEADEKFRESMTRGQKTDRGIIWVIYGEPEKIEVIDHRSTLEPPIERWTYPKSSPEGLDGEKPLRSYDFGLRENATIFYTEDRADMRRRQIQEQRRPPN